MDNGLYYKLLFSFKKPVRFIMPFLCLLDRGAIGIPLNVTATHTRLWVVRLYWDYMDLLIFL
jgi:hypothetical protein